MMRPYYKFYIQPTVNLVVHLMLKPNIQPTMKANYKTYTMTYCETCYKILR